LADQDEFQAAFRHWLDGTQPAAAALPPLTFETMLGFMLELEVAAIERAQAIVEASRGADVAERDSAVFDSPVCERGILICSVADMVGRHLRRRLGLPEAKPEGGAA
jgi:hypothetical protein